MKTFTDLYPETPKQSSITLIDKTTRRRVTFNEIETIQLQILVLQGEIPYDRFYKMLADTSGKDHKEYYILEEGSINPQLKLVSKVSTLQNKLNFCRSAALFNKIKGANVKF